MIGKAESIGLQEGRGNGYKNRGSNFAIIIRSLPRLHFSTEVRISGSLKTPKLHIHIESARQRRLFTEGAFHDET